MEKIHNEKRENKGKQNRRLAMENRPIGELAIDKSRLSDLEISQSMSEGSQGPESKVFKDTSIGRIEIIEESPNNNLCIRMVSKYIIGTVQSLSLIVTPSPFGTIFTPFKQYTIG